MSIDDENKNQDENLEEFGKQNKSDKKGENSQNEKINEIGISQESNGLNMIYDVPVNISAVIGSTQIKVSQLLKLGRGAIIELDKKVGDPVDIFVNNRLVAMGEIVVVDGNLGITMTEIVKQNI